MTARVSHIFDIALRAVLALALASLCVLQSAAHPRKADAVPIAVPIVLGIGTVVATALGVYGVQAVNQGRTAEDVGASFMNWCASNSKVLEILHAHNISNLQEFFNNIYSMAMAGSINLAEWTTNEQNAIAGVYAEVLSLWAADNFGAVSSEGIYVGDIPLNVYYQDSSVKSITGMSTWNASSPFLCTWTNTDGEFSGFFASPESGGRIAIGLSSVNDSFCISIVQAANNSFWTNTSLTSYNFTTQATTWGNSYVNSQTVASLDDIAFNTYYDIYVYSCPVDFNTVCPPYTGTNGRSVGGSSQFAASYNASTGVWTGSDVTVDPGIEGDIFDKFRDALNQGINDLLNLHIPLGADYVYNPSTQALEQQGSVPVVTDWTNIADWAGLLERLRAGLLDGTNVISNDTTGARANTIDDTIADGDELPDWPDDPWKTPSDDINTIGAAMAFTGESISKKFPFSTWGDVVAISHILSAPASAPEFDLPIIGFNGSGFNVERVHISLAPFEPVAIVVRLMFLILMILAVVWLAVRQLKVFAE